jgi:putative membrane protein
MEIVVQILVGIVAAFHLYVMWLEMFAWTTRGPKVFSQFPKELFPATKTLAANQGLYNGFLAAGLIWSYFIYNTEWQFHVRLFFLGCVAVAGIYGGFTASKKIFFVQGLPAIITIVLMHFAPFGCHEQCAKPVKEEIKAIYVGNHRYYKADTLSLSEIDKPHPKDSIIEEIHFEFIDKSRGESSGHVLVFYTNLNHFRGVDGEHYSASLDNIGIIYHNAISWDNVSALKTDNDSLNEIIEVGLAKLASEQTIEAYKLKSKYEPVHPKKSLAFIPTKSK